MTKIPEFDARKGKRKLKRSLQKRRPPSEPSGSSSKTKLRREIYAWNVNLAIANGVKLAIRTNLSFLYPLLCIYIRQIVHLLVRSSAWPGQVSFPDGKVWSMQRAEVEGKRSIHVCQLESNVYGDRYLSRKRVHLVSFVFIWGIIQDHGMGRKDSLNESFLK